MENEESNGDLISSLSPCKAPADESLDDFGGAIVQGDELAECKTYKAENMDSSDVSGQLVDLTMTDLESGPFVAEESSTSGHATTSLVLGFGKLDHSPLAHPTDAVHRRVTDSSSIFASNESEATGGVGLFKADKGNQDIFSPVQNQNPDFVYSAPVAESCHDEKALLVFLKGTVKHLHNEEFTLAVFEEGVDYERPCRKADWRKVRCIGRGASGTCFLYADRHSHYVVIKQMSTNFTNRAKWQCEVDVMRSIRHDNIIKFISAYEMGGHFNIVMEFMPGGSLEERIKNGVLSEDVIFDLTKQIMSGLAYLHNKLIAHRDIKAANLLLDSNGGNLRLADFGTAARFSNSEKFHIIAGTPPFMAPEVVLAHPDNQGYSQKCDVWSTGCVMIEMATGGPPWVQRNENYCRWSVLYMIGQTKTPPEMPSFQSKALQEVMVFCLRVDQDERPSSRYLHSLLLSL